MNNYSIRLQARGLGDIPEGVVGGGGVVAPKGVAWEEGLVGSVVAGELAAAGDVKGWRLKDTSESSICVRTFAADLTMSPIAFKLAGSAREVFWRGDTGQELPEIWSAVESQGSGSELLSIPHCRPTMTERGMEVRAISSTFESVGAFLGPPPVPRRSLLMARVFVLVDDSIS